MNYIFLALQSNTRTLYICMSVCVCVLQVCDKEPLLLRLSKCGEVLTLFLYSHVYSLLGLDLDAWPEFEVWQTTSLFGYSEWLNHVSQTNRKPRKNAGLAPKNISFSSKFTDCYQLDVQIWCLQIGWRLPTEC